MPIFEHNATFPFSRQTVWNWHARPGAVRRIMPDWEGIRPVQVGGITDGAVTEFRMSIGIVPNGGLPNITATLRVNNSVMIQSKDHSLVGTTFTSLSMVESKR